MLILGGKMFAVFTWYNVFNQIFPEASALFAVANFALIGMYVIGSVYHGIKKIKEIKG
jgi:hypothetical protein